ncbi:MAG: TolB family protein [Thermomicrobiales bacterium]
MTRVADRQPGQPLSRTQSIAPHVESIARETYPESGARVTQLTNAASIHTHIYPESPVFTPDSRRFVYSRFLSVDQPCEYWICDLTTHQLRPLTRPAEEPSVHGPVVSPDGRWFVYVSLPEEAGGDSNVSMLEVRRLSLDDPGSHSEVVCAIEGFRRPYPLGTISPDGRFYATSALQFLRSGEPPIAGILVVDLESMAIICVHQGSDIFNAHLQFEPGAGHDLLIQHNRGGILDEHGTIVRLVGEEGATFYVIDREGSNLRRLNIGTPHSRPVQGHQVWLGPTGRILSTLVRRPGDDPNEGDLVSIGVGDERPHEVALGWAFDHVAVTQDGRYFVCDVKPNAEIVVGSIATGRVRVLCESGASLGRPQYTHSHPFFSPDARSVLFNSDRTGLGQIYAATVPDRFLASLDE